MLDEAAFDFLEDAEIDESSSDPPTPLTVSPFLTPRSHTPPLSSLDSLGSSDDSQDADPGFECPLCYEWIHPRVCRQLSSCGHTLCVRCLIDYLRWAQTERKQPLCPTGRCKFLILELDARSAFNTEEAYEEWKQKSFRSWLFSQPNIFNCMAPDCPFAIALPADVRQFSCSVCGQLSCLDCMAIHTLLSCAEWQLRQARIGDPSKFLIEMLTKRCTRCRQGIMKEEACNHIMCRCGAHFCQVCLQHASNAEEWGSLRHFTREDATCPLFNLNVIVRSAASRSRSCLVKVSTNHLPSRISIQVHYEDGIDPGPRPTRTHWIAYVLQDCVLSIQNDVGEVPFTQKGGSIRFRESGVLPLACSPAASLSSSALDLASPSSLDLNQLRVRCSNLKLLTGRHSSVGDDHAHSCSHDAHASTPATSTPNSISPTNHPFLGASPPLLNYFPGLSPPASPNAISPCSPCSSPSSSFSSSSPSSSSSSTADHSHSSGPRTIPVRVVDEEMQLEGTRRMSRSLTSVSPLLSHFSPPSHHHPPPPHRVPPSLNTLVPVSYYRSLGISRCFNCAEAHVLPDLHSFGSSRSSQTFLVFHMCEECASKRR